MGELVEKRIFAKDMTFDSTNLSGGIVTNLLSIASPREFSVPLGRGNGRHGCDCLGHTWCVVDLDFDVMTGSAFTRSRRCPRSRGRRRDEWGVGWCTQQRERNARQRCNHAAHERKDEQWPSAVHVVPQHRNTDQPAWRGSLWTLRQAQSDPSIKSESALGLCATV